MQGAYRVDTTNDGNNTVRCCHFLVDGFVGNSTHEQALLNRCGECDRPRHSSSVAVADSHENESPHSLTNEGPTIQGGFDHEYVPFGFYIGRWASNIEFNTGGNTNDGSIEMSFYGGFAGKLANGIGWDVGGLYYYIPRYQ